jgi:hypothetical protein
MNKNIFLTVVVILTLVVSIAGIVLPKQVVVDSFGNATASFWDTAEGYKVDGTTVINGSGVITGTSQTLSSTLSVTGETQLAGLVSGGAVYTASLATSSIAAATVCDYGTWIITPTDAVSAVLKLTLPSTTTLAADCLDTVGDQKTIFMVNGATQATSTTFIAGLGIDLLKSGDTGSALAVAINERAIITFYRTSTATTSVYVESLEAAD